jgi:hypothetical protein
VEKINFIKPMWAILDWKNGGSPPIFWECSGAQMIDRRRDLAGRGAYLDGRMVRGTWVEDGDGRRQLRRELARAL